MATAGSRGRLRALLLLCGGLLAPALALAVGEEAAPREAEDARVRAAFERLDPDGDGAVEIAQLPALRRRLFELSDRDADGFLSLDEYRSFHADPGGAGRFPLPEGVELRPDIAYAGTSHPRQRLDLYLPRPRPAAPVPLVVYVHGGAWNMGSRLMGRPELARLVATGHYAGASLGYRLSPDAIWPAQIHDLKAALRWLRAHAGEYGFDPKRVGAVGASAGGHLAAMLGTSGGVAELEGALGAHLEQPTSLQCVVDFFGPVDLTRPSPASRQAVTGEGPSSREELLGARPEQVPELARSASPVSFASPGDPPFLLIHGTADPLVPFSESLLLEEALRGVGVDVALQVVEGGGHGDFIGDETSRRVALFFDACLRGAGVEVPTDALRYPPAPSAPGETGFVETDGERIYYEVTGEGDAIVFSHGFGGNHASWFQQALEFGRDYRVVTWDQRGFGRSTDRHGRAGPEAFAEDLGALLDHLGIERAHLVGQSMGGWTIVLFALRHPERVRSLVLSASVGGIFTPETRRAFEATVAASRDGRRGDGPDPVVPPESAYLYGQIASVAEPPAARIGESLVSITQPSDRVRALDVPVLFVSGERDPIFPPASIAAAAGLLPDSRVVAIPEAGHSGYFHQPEPWNAAVRGFLSALP